MIIAPILHKDVRRLWPQVAVFWVLLALAASVHPAYNHVVASHDYTALNLALVISCGSLIVGLIHQEALPGDRQYWLTRPIPLRTLLAAKALFLFLTVNVALLITQVATLAVLGIPAGDHIAALLWRQLFLTTFLVLPAAALGAVTRNLGQAFLVASLVAVVVIAATVQDGLKFFFHVPSSTPPYELILAFLSTVGAAAVLFIQYSRRGTRVAAAVMAAAIALLFLTNQGAVYPEPTVRKVQLTLDPSPRPPSAAPRAPGSLEIPIRIDGIPAGVDFTVVAVRAGIHSPRAAIHDFSEGHGWLTVFPGPGGDLPDPAVPGDWSGQLAVIVSRPGRSFPATDGVVIAGVGRCNMPPACLSPDPRTSLALESPNGARYWIVTQNSGPIPRIPYIGFGVVEKYTAPDDTNLNGARLIQEDLVERLHAEFHFQNLRLADYLPKRP